MLGWAPALALSDTSAQRWFRPAPGIGHCLAGDYRQDIPGCYECRPPGSELEKVPDRRIAARARSPPTGDTTRGPSTADWVRPRHASQGRPRVLLRRLHHARRHCVQFYVAHTGKEIFVRLH
jgi:hypothetical protein